MASIFLLEFTAIFAFIAVMGYLIPAGQYYLRFHVFKSPAKERRRVQEGSTRPGQIAREVRMSIVSIAIFAAMSTVLYELYKAGKTSIYLKSTDYPLIYLPISVFLCLVIHDTYFYWTHRLMHWRPLFKLAHAGHHRSVSPTPWAIFAFQPAEAIIQFLGIMALVIFLPLHPISLLVFLAIDTEVNTAGHTGYEMVPKFISERWIFRGFSTVAHHDNHHTNMSKNFGSFFNIWDRLMGTFEDAVPLARRKNGDVQRNSAVPSREGQRAGRPETTGEGPREGQSGNGVAPACHRALKTSHRGRNEKRPF